MDSTLERELSELEGKLEAAAKSAKSALSELKKAKVSAKVGQIRDRNKSLAEAANAAKRFADDVAIADSSWRFDAEAHFANGGYLTELLREAESANLTPSEQDGRVFCFPMLLTLSGKDIAVMIDRKPERRLRPRELVKLLSRAAEEATAGQ
jgi:hypothetical protein